MVVVVAADCYVLRVIVRSLKSFILKTTPQLLVFYRGETKVQRIKSRNKLA
jgi:hypothetical protein